MKYKTLHAWNLEPDAARELQCELAAQVREEPLDVERVEFVAGADMSFAASEYPRITPVFAGMVILRLPELAIMEQAGVQTVSPFPYVSGLLSFREVPPLLEVWARLQRRPDAVITDGQGRAHPRRFGLACHLGLLLDVPTIGVAKTRLIGTHEEVPNEVGGWTPLLDKGETIGAVLRARRDAAPVYVSVGHRVDLPGAIALVQRCLGKTRVPEPTRQAHLFVNSIRRDPSLLAAQTENLA